MTVRLNDASFTHAQKLISTGNFVSDLHGHWEEEKPTAATENAFIAEVGMAAYSYWHLGVDPEANPQTKGAYSFPYGNFTKVFRSGLIAIEERAAQYGHKDIEQGAQELLQLMEDK